MMYDLMSSEKGGDWTVARLDDPPKGAIRTPPPHARTG
jgi:hypothetical protein